MMPSKLERLITVLSRLGGDPIVAHKHAQVILWRMTVVATPSKGHDIGGGDDPGFYAHPRTSAAGLERELRDIGGRARKAVSRKLSIEAWMKAWAALPDRTKRLLWRPRLIQTTAKGRTVDRDELAASFSAPGFHMIVPKPELVLPAVEIALERLKAKPGAQRRKRQRDKAEHAATEAIRAAYQEVTGNKGGRVIRKRSTCWSTAQPWP